MQVDTNVDEADIGAVHAGQAATFTVDAYSGQTFRGLVADVRRAPINSQNVVTYDVVITVDNVDLKLFPGMTAKVTVLTEKRDAVLQVPNAALRFRPSPEVLPRVISVKPKDTDNSQVYLVAGTRITALPVTTGITDGKVTEVISPALHVGDTVIVRGVSPKASASSPVPPRRLPGP